MRIGGLFLHSNAHRVPINFNRSFALQLLIGERAPVFFYGILATFSDIAKEG